MWGAARGFWGWLVQWLVWDERPSAAQYRLACNERDDAMDEARRLRVELADAHARADSAEAEVNVLAAVVRRNQERVDKEIAAAAAERERAMNEAIAARGVRNPAN